MTPGNFLSLTDQVAASIREDIRRGRWGEFLPGKHAIAAELGVNNKTVEAALRQLEREGLAVSQGAGRPRRVDPARFAEMDRPLRIAFFLNEGMLDLKTEIFIEATRILGKAGHTVLHAGKSLSEIRFELSRAAQVVEDTPADAWVIFAGSREILEWFAQRPVPAFALFGHRIGIRIPAVSPDKPPAVEAATRHLMELGHSRIVLLCRKIRRLPTPGLSETVFLETLRAGGVHADAYHLPDWEETKEGFQRCLESLFKLTPPTALIVDEPHYFVAAMQFLLCRGLRVPADVSLVCTDDDPVFAHCHPRVACITWDRQAVLRRILNWAANVSARKPDVRQSSTPCSFTPGGTIGPPPPTLGL
jgi:DNA-binding LacI/PurR family transcriptional regulator